MGSRTTVGLVLALLGASAVVVPWGAAASTASERPAAPASPAVAEVRSVIAPWCDDVQVRVTDGTAGRSGFTSVWGPWGAGDPRGTEFIEVGGGWPDGHPATAAVALHECAHILQYRAYGYDYPALEAAMGRAYPDGPSTGVEHMADCVSDLMGAERRGRSSDGEWYEAGYGGDCSEAQSAAARRILDGGRA